MSSPFSKFGPRVTRVKATANITTVPLQKFKVLTDEQIIRVGDALLANENIGKLLATTKRSPEKVEEAFAKLNTKSLAVSRDIYLAGFILTIISLIGLSQDVPRDVTLFYTALNKSIDVVLAEEPGGGAGSAPPPSGASAPSSASSSSVSAPPPSGASAPSSSAPSSSVSTSPPSGASAPSSLALSSKAPEWTAEELNALGGEPEIEEELGGGARKRRRRHKTKRTKRSKRSKKTKRRSRK